MTMELRATGLTEEQGTALLDELSERGFGGARTTTSGGDENPNRMDVAVTLSGSEDATALSGFLESNRIPHALVPVER